MMLTIISLERGGGVVDGKEVEECDWGREKRRCG